MTFLDIPTGATVFLDANVFVYDFAPNPVLGPACRDLLERILRKDVAGVTSSHVLSNVAHRLMTIEAADQFGWPMAGIGYRLQQHPAEIGKLTKFRQSVEDILSFGMQVLAVESSDVVAAAEISQLHGLLNGDALIVALMESRGITNLASHDADFNRVPGVTRYAPA